jgi:hypothetical protein
VAERYLVTGPADRDTPVYADVLTDGSYRVLRAMPGQLIAGDELFMRITLAVDTHRARASHDGEWRPLGDLEERLACGGGRVPRPEWYTQELLTRRYGAARRSGRQWSVPVSDRDLAEHAAAAPATTLGPAAPDFPAANPLAGNAPHADAARPAPARSMPAPGPPGSRPGR